MTDATEQSKIMEAAHEAAAIARGDMPAGRWTIKGYTYVPDSEADDLRKQLQQKDNIIAQMKSDLSGMRCARDEWKRKAEVFEAQAKRKITDEWRRRVAAGEEGEV